MCYHYRSLSSSSGSPCSSSMVGVTALLDPASALSALVTPRLRQSLGCLGLAPGLRTEPSSGPSSSALSANTFSLLIIFYVRVIVPIFIRNA